MKFLSPLQMALFYCGMVVAAGLSGGMNAFAATSGGAPADWNISVLDQVIATVPAGEKYAQIDDMQVPVSYLQDWRNTLAGGAQPKSAFASGFTAWPSGNVYYAFDASVAATNQKVFLDCCAEWATFANLHFIPRTAQANYILVTNNATLNGGLSVVGMGGGAQLLQIGPTAWSHSVVVHELGHALGMVHEHQRSDRDSFVTINTNNIISGHLSDFVLLTTSQNKGAYDFLSVMHYGRNAFSVNTASNTIQTLPAYNQYLNIMGQRFDPVLSVNDRAGMALIYGAGPGASSVVTNTQDSGPGTLRAALYYAYDHPGTTITFNIPNTDPGFSNNVFNILPSDALPSLVNATILDGSTEPVHANASGPQILINGALSRPPSVYTSGIYLKGTNCTVRSLTVNNFLYYGIIITGTNAMNNRVVGCYVGINPTGTAAVTNGITPVHIEAGAISNIVGGATVADRNIISGSALQGLTISDPGTSFNVVKGNYIGLNATGTAALPNAWTGVELFNGASSNVIGGINAGEGNVISGNLNYGILFNSTGVNGNTILGNYVGLNAAGTSAIANSYAGIAIYNGASSNAVGGFVAGSRNVVSGNLNDGVLITDPGSKANLVAGNYIGLSPAGTSAIANNWSGVDLYNGTPNNVVAGNVISGNLNNGVLVRGDLNSIWGNIIGLNAAGSAAVANAYSGVYFTTTSQSNTLGGLTSSLRNVISGNTSDGVTFYGSSVTKNVVEGNYIGVNAVGTAALANGGSGVDIFGTASGNLIGGSASGAGNLISGNNGQGIIMTGAGTVNHIILGNWIGLNAAGLAAVPNTGTGIYIGSGASGNTIGGIGGGRNFISGNGNYGIAINNGSIANVVQGNTIGLNATNGAAIANSLVAVVFFFGAPSNTVGGITPGAANLISASTADGVQIIDVGTTNVTVRGNSIFNDTGNAIGIYNSANRSIVAPTLASAVVTTNTVISGTYNGVNGAIYQLDFYSDAVVSGAESMTYLGSKSFTGTGGASGFTANLGVLLPAGRGVTASATDAAGNTSTLSAGVASSMTSANNDGIPNAWRNYWFGTTVTNSTSYAGGDPDHDGLSNLQEFLAGTYPTNAASVFKLTAQNPFSTANAVAINSPGGIVYRVLYRDDLLSGNWNILADQVIGTGATLLLADPGASASTKRFYRAQVLW